MQFEINAKEPDYLKDHDGKVGAAENHDLLASVPRMMLLDKSSKPVQDFMEGAVAGKVWSTKHRAPIGGVAKMGPNGIEEQTPVIVVPLKAELEWIRFDDDGNLMWRTQDPDSQLVQDLGDQAYKFKQLHFLVLAPINNEDYEPQPMILTFKGSNYKIGLKWYDEMDSRKGDMYTQVYELSVMHTKDGNYSWFSFIAPKFLGYSGSDLLLVSEALARDQAGKRLLPNVVPEEQASSSEEKALQTKVTVTKPEQKGAAPF